MKLFLSLGLSLLTILGIASSDYELPSQFFNNGFEVSQIRSDEQASVDCSHEQESSDCHDGSHACRVCHLGHCAVTLSSVIEVKHFFQSSSPVMFDSKVVTSDFSSVPYRPPIT